MTAALPGDPGLQPERTDLAWRRTHLSVVVAALAVARHPLAGDEPLLLLFAAVAVAGLVAFLLLARRRVPATATVVTALAVAELAGNLGATGVI